MYFPHLHMNIVMIFYLLLGLIYIAFLSHIIFSKGPCPFFYFNKVCLLFIVHILQQWPTKDLDVIIRAWDNWLMYLEPNPYWNLGFVWGLAPNYMYYITMSSPFCSKDINLFLPILTTLCQFICKHSVVINYNVGNKYREFHIWAS